MIKTTFRMGAILVFLLRITAISGESRQRAEVDIEGTFPMFLFDQSSVLHVQQYSTSFGRQFATRHKLKGYMTSPSLTNVKGITLKIVEGGKEHLPSKNLFAIFSDDRRYRTKYSPPFFIDDAYQRDFSIEAQMESQWVGSGINYENLLVFQDLKSGGRGRIANLGNLFSKTYRKQFLIIGVEDRRKKFHAEADGIKPRLFFANGRYYNVFGDTKVPTHIAVVEYPGSMSNIYLPGNILFPACTTLPPTLQSCGKDVKGKIWVADTKGHLVAFDTSSNGYHPYLVRCRGTERLCIPRRNLSGAVFAYDKNRKVFAEHALPSVQLADSRGKRVKGEAVLNYSQLPRIGNIPTADATVCAHARTVSGDTIQILHCDTDLLVYITSTKAVMQRVGAKDISSPVALQDSEMIEEGIYDPKNRTVHLLTRPKAKDESNPFQRRSTWKRMTLKEVIIP